MTREETIKRYLNPTEYFKDKLSLYIKVFAQFYGVEEYDDISSKFTHMFPIFYLSEDDLRDNLRVLETIYGKEYMVNNYSEYYRPRDNINGILKRLNDKYNKEFIKRIIDYLPEMYKDKAGEYLDSDEDLYSFCIKNGCGDLNIIINNFAGENLYSFFTTRRERLLSYPNVGKDDKNRILNNRIKFFKAIGIDRGDDYSNYEDLIGNVISFEIADKIEAIQTDIYELYQRELSLSKYPDKEFIEKGEEIGLLWDITGVFSDFSVCPYFMSPNFIIKDGKLELFPVMIIDGTDDSNLMDQRIIHELNHVDEYSIDKKSDHIFVMKTGFEVSYFLYDGSSLSLLQNKEDGKYKRFSETINELISWDIFEIFQNLFESALGSIENEEISNCDYLNQVYIVKEFYETYKDEIIQARKDKTLDCLFDRVGRENFEALNDLVNEDYEMIDHVKLESDLEDGIESDLTRRYHRINERKNEILADMKSHNMHF